MTGSTRDGIRDAVMAELTAKIREKGLEGEEIDGAFDLFGTGLIDSIAFVDLLLAVETRLGLQFELELLDFDRLASLDELVAELDRVLLGAQDQAAREP